MPNQRDLRKEATRRKVFEAALTVFRRDGIQAARVEDIVRLAGVSRGTFYFHFATKELVILELVGEQQARMRDRMLALPPEASLRDILCTLADAYAEQWGDEPHLILEAGPIVLRYAARTIPAPEGIHPSLDALMYRLRHVRDPAAEATISTDLAARMFLLNLLVGALAWAKKPDSSLRRALDPVVAMHLGGLSAS